MSPLVLATSCLCCCFLASLSRQDGQTQASSRTPSGCALALPAHRWVLITVLTCSCDHGCVNFTVSARVLACCRIRSLRSLFIFKPSCSKDASRLVRLLRASFDGEPRPTAQFGEYHAFSCRGIISTILRQEFSKTSKSLNLHSFQVVLIP